MGKSVVEMTIAPHWLMSDRKAWWEALAGKKMAESLTDNYGDFKFDRLEENSGPYVVEILLNGYEKKTLEVDLKTSLNVGNICLYKSKVR